MDRSISIVLTFIDQASAAIGATTSAIKSSLGGLGTQATNTGGIMSRATGSIVTSWQTASSSILGSMGKILTGGNALSSLFVGGAITAGIKNLIDMGAQFERFGIAAEFLTGSKKAADEFAQSVRKMAVETMFNVDQIAELDVRLVGNTKNVKQSEGALRALADAVAATGGGYPELESSVRAWIQTNSKAIASSEELNRQFANANIPVLRVLAESIEKDANHPLRKYLAVAGEGGATGVSKKLATAFGKANETIQDAGWKTDKLTAAMNKAKDKYGESSYQFREATEKLGDWNEKVSAASGTIDKFNSAQSTMTTSNKKVKMTVEDIMSQLQSLGDLKIPGAVMADEITKALNQAYGGANAKLIETFQGQMSMLRDVFVLTGLAVVGLDENFRPIQGGLIDILSKALKPIVKFLQDHQQDIVDFFSKMENGVPVVIMLAVAFGVLLKAIFGMILPVVATGIAWGVLAALAYKAIQLIVDKMGGWQVVMEKGKIMVENMRDAFQEFYNFLEQHSEVVKALIIGFATAIAIILIPALLSWLATQTAVAVAVVISFAPVIAIIALITVIVAALYLAWQTNFMGIRDIVNNVVTWFNDTALPIIRVVFEEIKKIVGAVMDNFKEKFDTAKLVVEELHKFLTNVWFPITKKNLEILTKILDTLVPGWINHIDDVTEAFKKVASAIGNVLGKVDELSRKVTGSGIAGNILKTFFPVAGLYQHGGIVPGPVGSPVPIIAHGGERVVPTSGMGGGGGGGGATNINFYGSVNMDSEERVYQLAEQITRIMGRQNELARYGAGY